MIRLENSLSHAQYALIRANVDALIIRPIGVMFTEICLERPNDNIWMCHIKRTEYVVKPQCVQWLKLVKFLYDVPLGPFSLAWINLNLGIVKQLHPL